MPKVKFDVNIGRPDAQRLGLDPEKAKAGNVLDVDQDVADVLIRNLWARPTDEDVTAVDDGEGDGVVVRATPAPTGKVIAPSSIEAKTSGTGSGIDGVMAEDGGTGTTKDTAAKQQAKPATASTAPTPGEPAPPDFDAMTKEDIKAYADANKIEGVNLAMHKDEMVRIVKRANRSAGR